MQIKLPTYDTITLGQLNALKFLKEEEDTGVDDMVTFLNSFLDIDRQKLLDASVNSVQELFYECLGILNEFPKDLPQQETITIQGTTYTLRQINNTMPSSWFVFAQKLLNDGIQSHQLMALIYVEEGMLYNERHPKAEREILNPFQKRADLFEKHGLAIHYLPVAGFFLKKFNEYKKPFLALQKARTKLRLQN